MSLLVFSENVKLTNIIYCNVITDISPSDLGNFLLPFERITSCTHALNIFIPLPSLRFNIKLSCIMHIECEYNLLAILIHYWLRIVQHSTSHQIH